MSNSIIAIYSSRSGLEADYQNLGDHKKHCERSANILQVFFKPCRHDVSIFPSATILILRECNSAVTYSTLRSPTKDKLNTRLGVLEKIAQTPTRSIAAMSKALQAEIRVDEIRHYLD